MAHFIAQWVLKQNVPIASSGRVIIEAGGQTQGLTFVPQSCVKTARQKCTSCELNALAAKCCRSAVFDVCIRRKESVEHGPRLILSLIVGASRLFT